MKFLIQKIFIFQGILVSIYVLTYSVILMIFPPCMTLKTTSFKVLLTNLVKLAMLMIQSYNIKRYVSKLH